MATSETKFIGRHEYRFQPPDRVDIILHGVMDAQDVDVQYALVWQWREKCGQQMRLICHLGDFGGATSDARTAIVRSDRGYPYFGVAFLGGSFVMRTIASTLIRAGRSLSPQHFTYPVFFGKTLEECEAWLDSVQPRGQVACGSEV